MSLKIQTAKTAPLRIEIDLQTDAGHIKGFFTGHAFVRSKPDIIELQKRLDTLANDDQIEPLAREEKVLREMFEKFEGLANEGGELIGDAAFNELVNGPLSVALTHAATQAYWAFMSGDARQGNSKRPRGR